MMKITISHIKNVVIGWNIDVSVEADDGETISFVEARVNGFPEIQETPDDGVSSFDQQITGKGVFPGDNKVEVLARNQNGDERRSEQHWS
jgi:hypothetical protein